jgi:hypothetical protein
VPPRRRTPLGEGGITDGLHISESCSCGKEKLVKHLEVRREWKHEGGPFTVNSRGKGSIRLGKGLSYRGSCLAMFAIVVASAASATTVLSRAL